jgi:hypothetical protein
MTEQEVFAPMIYSDNEIQRSNSITSMSTSEFCESEELEENLLVQENYENKLIYYIKNVNINE